MNLLASGRDCDVFDLGDGTVLRRNRAGRSLDEAEVMAHVVDAGFPCPRVHRAEGPDLVLDLVAGPTMLDVLLADPTARRGADAGEVLGELHDRLHRIAGLRRETLLHLDLHPGNVVLAPDGPVLIDWTNAADGPPGLDVAVTWVTLVPYLSVVEAVVAPMIDALLTGPRGEDARAHVLDAARARLADRNLTDHERAAISDFVNASG